MSAFLDTCADARDREIWSIDACITMTVKPLMRASSMNLSLEGMRENRLGHEIPG
jgi:hypothetical protein